MDVKKYISSGILELYIAGVLSEKENQEVHANALEYPEILAEIEAIEAAILELTAKASSVKPNSFQTVKGKIDNDEPKVIPISKEKGNNWTQYLGWAASILLAIGLFMVYNQNKVLKLELKSVEIENNRLEQQIADSDTSLEKTKSLLNTIRDKDITVVPLGGQTISPDSYAKAYWNKQEEKVFIDAQGLPEPPDGFVYQVWSLKLAPLTPTSMGLLEDFEMDENKVFTLNNPNESEAFGITLEPAGGSESPNLEQLYTLGVVSTS